MFHGDPDGYGVQGLLAASYLSYPHSHAFPTQYHTNLASSVRLFIYEVVQPTLISRGVQGEEAAFVATTLIVRDVISQNLPSTLTNVDALNAANSIILNSLKLRDNDKLTAIVTPLITSVSNLLDAVKVGSGRGANP